MMGEIFSDVLKNILVFILSFIGILLVIFVIIFGGINYFNTNHPEGLINYLISKVIT